MTGKDLVTVIVNPAFYLSIKMDELDDFSRVVSQLQFVVQKLGVEV